MKKLLPLLIITICIVLCGCQKSDITCKITFPYNEQTVLLNQDLMVRIDVKATKSSVTNVVVSYANFLSSTIPHSITLTSEPYTVIIPSEHLVLGKLTITAIATNDEDMHAETSVTVNVVEKFDFEEKESPDFVTFGAGPLPDGWKTYTWEIANIGYDDGYSLKSANPTALVYASKTIHKRSVIQYYTKGEAIDFYIDDVKSYAITSEPDGTWRKLVHIVDTGKHTFRWQTEGALKYLDAVSFSDLR